MYANKQIIGFVFVVINEIGWTLYRLFVFCDFCPNLTFIVTSRHLHIIVEGQPQIIRWNSPATASYGQLQLLTSKSRGTETTPVISIMNEQNSSRSKEVLIIFLSGSRSYDSWCIIWVFFNTFLRFIQPSPTINIIHQQTRSFKMQQHLYNAFPHCVPTLILWPS